MSANLDTVCVLVVEDELLVSLDLQDVLQDLGFSNVEIAYNGREALEIAKKVKPDLLVMDINLGRGPDGVEVVEQLQTRADPKVIFVTAYADEDTLQRITNVASDAPVLLKPISLPALRSAIAQVLGAD